MANQKSLLVGIAGGSGSGKTTFCNQVAQQLGDDAFVLSSDHYYRSLDDLPLEERAHINFDHPDSIDFELLQTHLKSLADGKSISVPQYDFSTHLRRDESTNIEPAPIVLVEGVLVLANEQLCEGFDLTIFVDANADMRLARRIHRDTAQRGRSEASVRKQWNATVAPMFDEFVRPSRGVADIIINGETPNDQAVKVVAAGLLAQIV